MPTIYMSTTGNDSNDGSAPTDAKAKLTLTGASGAVNAASDGDTIEVVAGTYTAQRSFSAAICNGKSLIIKPYSGGAVIWTSTSTNYPVYTGNEANSGTITIQDITINSGDSSRTMLVYLLGEKSFTFERCTMTGAESYLLYATSGTNTANRVVRFTDCTLQASASPNNHLLHAVTGSLIVTGGTVNSRAYAIMSVGGAMVVATLDGVTNVGNAGYVIRNYTGTALSAGALTIRDCVLPNIKNQIVYLGTEAITSLKIHDNTFAANASDTDRVTAMLYDLTATGCTWISIVGNTCTDFADGIKSNLICNMEVRDNSVTITKAIGVSSGYCLSFGKDNWVAVDPDNAELGTLASKCYVIGNRIEVTATGARHATFLGMAYAGIVFHGNTLITRNCGTNNYGLVIKAQGASVVGNVIDAASRALYLAGAKGCYVAGNTVLSQDTFALGFSAAGRDPAGNVIVNNALEAPASVYVIDWQDHNSTYGNLIEYNMFSHFRVRFNNTAYTTLAALVAAQAAYKQINGEAMHENDLWEPPYVTSDYRVGNRRAAILGMPLANGQRGTMGVGAKTTRLSPLVRL